MKEYNMSVTVYYLGVLSEITGKSTELIDETGTKEQILEILLDMHPGLKKLNFVLSLNGTITHGDKEINSGDQVTLIPPVPGG